MSKEIAVINLPPMPNGAHYNFMQTMLERVKATDVVKTKLEKDVAALEAALAVENDNLKVSQKSSLTAGISDGDVQRDAFFIGYKSAVKGFRSLPDGDMKDAALCLWEHLENYDLDPRAQLDKQTGMMTNFLEDLENKFKDDVATLGLTAFVTNMKTANEQVRTLMKQRDDEYSAKMVGAMKAARSVSDEAYRLVVKKINALALIEGEDDYARLIDEMNAQILRYKREVLKQKVSGADKDDSPVLGPSEPENPDEGEDDRPVIE